MKRTATPADARVAMIVLEYAAFGIVVRDDVVIDAPPIAAWAIGCSWREVADRYRAKGARFCEAITSSAPG